VDKFAVFEYAETTDSLKSNRPTHKLSFGKYAFDLILDTILEHSNMILVPKNSLVVIESDPLHNECLSIDQHEVGLIRRLLGLPVPTFIVIVENISPRIVGKCYKTAQILVFTFVVNGGDVLNAWHDVILSERSREGLPDPKI